MAAPKNTIRVTVDVEVNGTRLIEPASMIVDLDHMTPWMLAMAASTELVGRSRDKWISRQEFAREVVQ